jgi:putative chitinase
MTVDAKTLARCTGARLDRAQRFADVLSAAMAFYGIDTPMRQAMFLANVGHESAGLHYTTELWGPTAAQQGYEGRKDLDNTQPGDGFRFRGHGLIQTTGRANHAAATERLRARFSDVPDFVAQPDLLAEPQWAALSAADYVDMKRLNAVADSGNFREYVRKVNGGFNGMDDRLRLYEAARAALEPNG